MFTALTGLKRPGEELKALSKNLPGLLKIGMKRIFGTNPKITKIQPSLKNYAMLIENTTKK